MPHAQVAIVTLDQSAEDEVGGGFLDAGHVLLFPLLA
jgi:hypothetical protein